MTLVSNSTKSPLILPTGERIEPGGSAEVADWAKAQESAQIARWVETGALVEGELPPPVEGGEPLVEHVEANVGNRADAETIQKLDMPTPYDYTPPPVNEVDPPPIEDTTDTRTSRRGRRSSEEESF